MGKPIRVQVPAWAPLHFARPMRRSPLRAAFLLPASHRLPCRGRLAQLVRAPRLHRGGRGFEPLTAHFRPTLAARKRPSERRIAGGSSAVLASRAQRLALVMVRRRRRRTTHGCRRSPLGPRCWQPRHTDRRCRSRLTPRCRSRHPRRPGRLLWPAWSSSSYRQGRLRRRRTRTSRLARRRRRCHRPSSPTRAGGSKTVPPMSVSESAAAATAISQGASSASQVMRNTPPVVSAIGDPSGTEYEACGMSDAVALRHFDGGNAVLGLTEVGVVVMEERSERLAGRCCPSGRSCRSLPFVIPLSTSHAMSSWNWLLSGTSRTGEMRGPHRSRGPVPSAHLELRSFAWASATS